MVLSLSGEVNEDMYNKVLSAYIAIKDNKAPQIGGQLDIFINSEGGDVLQGLAIYDIIRLIKSHIKVRTIGVGLVASSAITIFLAGDYRESLENTFFMIHYGETSCNSVSEMRYNKKLLDIHLDLMDEVLNVSRKTIMSWHNGDHYFCATRAVELGLVEYII